MTDPGLIAKKLAFIETRLRELSTLARLDRIRDDLKEERFVEHTLQLAIQADAVQNRLEDLVAFVTAVRRRLTAP